jgi:hypothetical protein
MLPCIYKKFSSLRQFFPYRSYCEQRVYLERSSLVFILPLITFLFLKLFQNFFLSARKGNVYLFSQKEVSLSFRFFAHISTMKYE